MKVLNKIVSRMDCAEPHSSSFCFKESHQLIFVLVQLFICLVTHHSSILYFNKLLVKMLSSAALKVVWQLQFLSSQVMLLHDRSKLFWRKCFSEIHTNCHFFFHTLIFLHLKYRYHPVPFSPLVALFPLWIHTCEMALRVILLILSYLERN